MVKSPNAEILYFGIVDINEAFSNICRAMNPVFET